MRCNEIFLSFSIVEGGSVSHHCLVCLTNQGDVMVYSVPQLKQQMKANVMRREDIR